MNKLDSVIDLISLTGVVEFAKQHNILSYGINKDSSKDVFITQDGLLINFDRDLFFSKFLKEVYDVDIPEEEINPNPIIDYFISKLDFIRLNTIDDTCYLYCSSTINNKQKISIKSWLILQQMNKVDTLEVEIPKRVLQSYDLEESSAEQIIQNINKLFNSVVNENLFIHKTQFNKLLLEVTRRDILNKSRTGANYKDQSKGKNRYERRTRSRNITGTNIYNQISMDIFFKKDVLVIPLQVLGETDTYRVTIRFENILHTIQETVKSSDNKVDFKIILRALLQVFNQGNVWVSCTCKDFTYAGFNYYSAHQGFNAAPIGGAAMQAPNIKNPHDDKGAGCKHILLILGNLDWMMKVASVINNYIVFASKNMEKAYADIIYPAVYGKKFEGQVQLSLFDDEPTIDKKGLTTSQVYQGRDNKGRFTSNNPYKWKSQNKPKEDPKQLHLDIPEEKPTVKKPIEKKPIIQPSKQPEKKVVQDTNKKKAVETNKDTMKRTKAVNKRPDVDTMKRNIKKRII